MQLFDVDHFLFYEDDFFKKKCFVSGKCLENMFPKFELIISELLINFIRRVPNQNIILSLCYKYN